MRWLIASSVRLAAALSAAAAVLLVVAVIGLRHAPVDVLPQFGPTRVEVQTEALGLSAAEVEQLITVPLEDEFNGLAFLEHVRSRSLPGLSDIELTFHSGTDLYQARQLLTERVAQGPALVAIGTPPVMIQPLSVEGRALNIGLDSTSMSQTDLSTLARWRIRPRLLAVPGVANVVLWGERDQQLQVLADPARMRQNDVTLDQVINTAGDAMWTSPLTFVEASSPGADGFIDTPDQRLTIQHILPITSPPDLAAVPLEDTKDKSIPLGAVATVVSDHAPLRGDAVLKSGPGFLMVVEKLPGADPAKVAQGVDAALAELKPEMTGVTVDTGVFRPATFVDSALRHLGWTALIGLVLLTVWLGIAWRSWRVALIALVSLALPVVGAAYVLYLAGTTFTTMTLAGLMVAVGVAVDDAVRTADVLRRAGREGLVEAGVAIRRPLTIALAVLALAAVPFLFRSGPDGGLTRPLIIAYLLAVAFASLITATVTPALAHLLLRAPLRGEPGRWDRRFGSALTRYARSGVMVFGTIAVLVVCALAVIPQLGSGPLIPTMQDRSLLVRWQEPAGSSLPLTEQTATTMAAALRGVPGVVDVASDVGQALMGDRRVDVNSAQTWITLSKSVDYGKAKGDIQHVLAGYSNVQPALMTYTAASLADNRTQNGPALTVRVYGTDPATLAANAAQFQKLVSSVHGVNAPTVSQPTQATAIRIAVDVDRAAAHGLKPGDIRRATAVLLAGIPVGSYYQAQQIFDVAVWSAPQMRATLADVQNLPLNAPNGGQVALRDVASVTQEPTPTEVDHDQASRYVDVVAGVRGETLGTVLGKVETLVRGVALPVGYHAEVLSDKQQRQSDNRLTWIYAAGAAIGIFLLLQAALRSWGRAALLFGTVPLGMAGGAVTAAIAGSPLTAGALVGFLAVFGLAVRSGLVVLRDLQRREDASPHTLRADLAVLVAQDSAFPTVVTTVGLVLAMLPFAFAGDIAGLEIARPLALVVIGGAITSALVSLVLLPALCVRWSFRRRHPGTATARVGV